MWWFERRCETSDDDSMVFTVSELDRGVTPSEGSACSHHARTERSS